MLSTFLIALREGLEAALIVSILLAYLKRTERSGQHLIWIGVTAAVALSLGLGAFLSFTSTELSHRGEEIFAGTTSLAAVSFVVFMVFWMKHSARTIGKDLQGKVENALPLGGIGLISVAFFAVVREGLETALFLYSNFKTVSSNSAPAAGLIIGLIGAVSLGVLLYRKSIKINLTIFFRYTGLALLVVAAGVLSHAIGEFQSFGALPGADSYAWNLGHKDSWFTTILDGTVGISTSITWVQLAIWAAFIATTLNFFLKSPIAAKVPVAA